MGHFKSGFGPLKQHLWEIAALLAVLLLATALRLYHLDTLPAGLHGDEAITGMIGRKILNEGYIGPYSPSAVGQPLGPMYLTAVSVSLLGNTIFAVRVASAAWGVLTVLATYLITRRFLGVRAAFLSSILLTTMGWHIHFTRIGFPLSSWPLIVLVSAAALAEATRSGKIGWWIAGGSLTGLSVYSYNADPIAIAILVLFALLAALYALLARRKSIGRMVANLSAMFVSLALLLLPMALYALDKENRYFSHFRRASVLQSNQFPSHDLLAVASLLAHRYVEYWNLLSLHPRFDLVDATGVVPIVPLAMLILAGIGIIAGIPRRNPLIYLAILFVLLMPLAYVFSHGGIARRTFAMTPFLAILAALPLDEALRQARLHALRKPVYPVAILCVCVLMVVLAGVSARDYFVTFASSGRQRAIFTEEMTDAVLFMRQLPEDSYIYFYSNRWSFNYETRLFLAPNLHGVDKSAEFGQPGISIDPQKGKPVFVLIGNYKGMLSAIEARYPGGKVRYGPPISPHNHDPTFVAYSIVEK